MSYIALRGRWCDIIILNVHAPTEDKCDDSKDSCFEEVEGAFDQFLKYHMKILFGDLNAKVGREDIFKPTIGNDSLHETSNDNGVRVVNFATLKNLVVKSTMFPHRKSHKYTWTSPEGTNHYLLAAELRERLSVSKRVAEKLDIQRFDVRKLNDAEVKEQYHVKITDRFAALENFDHNVDINRAWENIRENIEISAKQSLGHYE
jgi:hypothetical protein